MKLLMRVDNPIQANILRDTLRAAGIDCELRNTTLSGALGEIPWLECAPQLWLQHASDEERARDVLAEIQRPSKAAPWQCSNCGETLDGQFGACWRCGTARGSE